MAPLRKVGVWHLVTKLYPRTKCECWEGSWGKEEVYGVQSAISVLWVLPWWGLPEGFGLMQDAHPLVSDSLFSFSHADSMKYH